MGNREMFFHTSPWTGKELGKLLLLVLFIVPVFIEFLLKHHIGCDHGAGVRCRGRR